MKKTSKIFGAVVCSAALAVGCAMPAFATSSEPDVAKVSGTATDYTGKDSEQAPKTDIRLRATTDQVNCALPLKMTVVASTAGGQITCPEATSYKIVNNSETGTLYVTGYTATLDGTTGSGDSAKSTLWTPSGHDTMPTSLTKKGNPQHGTVYMQLTAGTNPMVLLTNVNNDANSASSIKTGTVKWSVDPKKDGTAGSLGLALAGWASPIEGVSTDLTAGEALMSVSYTVSAMDPDAYTSIVEGDKTGTDPAIPSA